MSTNARDLRDTIVPKSDQLNAEQLLSGPITITVTDVRRGGGEDQPVIIHYEGEGGRPYKPCKSMRKVLVFAWGADGSLWTGRSMTLFNRPDVKFGGEEVGGIRISHLSHIDRDIAISLTATRGRKEQTRIKRLDESQTVQGSRSRLEAAARGGTGDLRAAWTAIPADHKRAIGGAAGCPNDLKQIAKDADARNDATPAVPAGEATFDDVQFSLRNATNLEELDAAFALVESLPEGDAAELTEEYRARRVSLTTD